MDDSYTPTRITLLQKKYCLEIEFNDNIQFELPCEYLRVFSPSAEVKGHGQSESKLIPGKRNVNIIGIDPIGNYAVKLVFDDGHDTGLYSFRYLYELGEKFNDNWKHYLSRLEEAGASRD